MIEHLCKLILSIVTRENENEEWRANERLLGKFEKNTNNYDISQFKKKSADSDNIIPRIINLSKDVMKFLDDDTMSELSPNQIDQIIYESLLSVYRMPSVVKSFETEVLAFHDWWRIHIKRWIRQATSHKLNTNTYRQLGWRHLTTMIQETRGHLQSTTRSNIVRMTGSKISQYNLASEVESQNRYYSAQRIAYKKVTPLGMTLNLSVSDARRDRRHSLGRGLGRSLWLLRELQQEQRNNDHCCALPRSKKRRRTSLITPLNGLNRCFDGSLPLPTLVPVGLALNSGSNKMDTLGHRLAYWILEEKLLNTGWSMCKDDVIDTGIASALEFLIDLYEENRDDLLDTLSCQGMESFEKFSAVCIEHSEQYTSKQSDGDARRKKKRK